MIDLDALLARMKIVMDTHPDDGGQVLLADGVEDCYEAITRLRAENATLKKAETRRKVVQLIVLPQEGRNENELYALADDGTIWQRYEPNGWSQWLDIPQPFEEVSK